MTDGASSLDEVRQALARGDVLIAYDTARGILEADPDDLDARWLVALALSRAGVLEHAGREVAELRRRLERESSAPVVLREDADALVARIAKQQALEAGGPEGARLAADAAALYEAAADRYDRYFSCVNAASLWLIAGDRERARRLATRTRTLVAATSTPDDRYWQLASDAEAALVLGDVESARVSLEHAAAIEPVDLGARATTRRQLRVVCAAAGIDAGLLDVLTAPVVLHYCGHLIGAGAGSSIEAELPRVAVEVERFLEERDVGFAYGSLASGADIVVAEQLLDRGVELHVVLPFAVDEFVLLSVAPAGAEWQERFHRCLGRATTVTLASDSAYAGDDELFGYGARIAMGHAVNRASFLDTAAEQLAVWDGQPAHQEAGTAHDVAVWRRTGRRGHVIDVAPRARAADVATSDEPSRQVRAILFADFHGFSRLRDEHFRTWVQDVLGSLARVLDEYRDALQWRSSWGDAVQAVFADVRSAARCALALQRAVASLDADGLGLPIDLDLRIGVHAGPVLCLYEPVSGNSVYWGRELTRAARIEPRTPEGEVYVTDAFAALLALEPTAGVRPEYVGRVTTAKDFETIPMYRLRDG